jgi:hypothetical protein
MQEPREPREGSPPSRSLLGTDHIGCLAMAGLLLCSTVVGAVIGVPLLLVSFVLLLAEFLRRRRAQTVTGHCPFCRTSICLEGTHARCACHGCGRALRVVEGRFVPAPD